MNVCALDMREELGVLSNEIDAAESYLEGLVDKLVPDIRLPESTVMRMVKESLTCQVVADRLIRLDKEYDEKVEAWHRSI